MTTTTTKNKYEKADDKIILEALERSPNNISEALRIAKEELKKKRGKNATVNQLSSRYYSYIVPHYIEGDEEIEVDVKDNQKFAFSSAGTFPKERIIEEAEEARGAQLDTLKRLAGYLPVDGRQKLIDFLFTTLE